VLILYSLNEVISKIRSFAFCTNLWEVSSFLKNTVHEAISKILSGDGLSIVLRKTDMAAPSGFQRAAFRLFQKALHPWKMPHFGEPHTENPSITYRRDAASDMADPEAAPSAGDQGSEMKKSHSLFARCT